METQIYGPQHDGVLLEQLHGEILQDEPTLLHGVIPLPLLTPSQIQLPKICGLPNALLFLGFPCGSQPLHVQINYVHVQIAFHQCDVTLLLYEIFLETSGELPHVKHEIFEICGIFKQILICGPQHVAALLGELRGVVLHDEREALLCEKLGIYEKQQLVLPHGAIILHDDVKLLISILHEVLHLP